MAFEATEEVSLGYIFEMIMVLEVMIKQAYHRTFQSLLV